MSLTDFWQISTPLRAVVLVDISSAIIAHAWFRKYEPRNIRDCFAQLAIFAIAPIVTAIMTLPTQSPLVNGPLHLTLFICFLSSSIILYRLSPFHPLAKYPGPLSCKVSRVWVTWLSHKGRLHLYYNKLHKKYGPIVRIGPNELSIVDVNLIPEILGQHGMPKGPLWDGRLFLSHKMGRTLQGVISVRDLNIHAQLRKPWNRSFGPNPVKDYEESLIDRGTELIEHLRELCRSSRDQFGHADIAEYISRWSFDFMGDMAFGESFGLMRTGDEDGILNKLEAAVLIPSITQMIPWASSFFRSIPVMNKGFEAFNQFALTQVQKRITKVTDKKDLFYYMAASMDIDDDKPPLSVIIANVGIAIVAGSDTTSTVLSGIMYYLLRYPAYLQRLRQELDTAFPPVEHATIQLDKLANLEMLNAVVNEVLRLQPPVLTGLQRAPTQNSGGKLVGDMFITEGTAVRIAPYVIHRDPRYFYPKPDEFWPERWVSQNQQNGKVITNRLAFIPFSYGPANCAGKTLAISELRYITAMLVYNFEFCFEDGYNPAMWDQELCDQFVLVVGKLPVKMKQRSFI